MLYSVEFGFIVGFEKGFGKWNVVVLMGSRGEYRDQKLLVIFGSSGKQIDSSGVQVFEGMGGGSQQGKYEGVQKEGEWR